MDSYTGLNFVLWTSLLLSFPLMIISTMACGKHVADLQYQKARKLNGIRWIQSWVNLRLHGNRVFFSFVFAATSLLAIFDVNLVTRTWFGRIGFLLVLLLYTLSAILDWFAEIKQLRILLKFEEVNNIPKMRLSLHALNGKLTEYHGYATIADEGRDRMIQNKLDSLLGEIKTLVNSLQDDLHGMDPSFVGERNVQPKFFGESE